MKLLLISHILSRVYFRVFPKGENGRGFDLKGGQLLIIIFICNVNFDVFWLRGAQILL